MISEIEIRSSKKEELIDVTREVERAIMGCAEGACVIYTPHTTAGITINENADPDVVRDILYGLKKIVPEGGYHHGEGNSSSHIKSSMIGCSETVIIQNGKLLLGTWQGIYFCEFDGPRKRKIFIKMLNG